MISLRPSLQINVKVLVKNFSRTLTALTAVSPCHTRRAKRLTNSEIYKEKTLYRRNRGQKIIRTATCRLGSYYSGLVPVVGLEPTRSRLLGILSPVRLPFRHTGVPSGAGRDSAACAIDYNARRDIFQHILPKCADSVSDGRL